MNNAERVDDLSYRFSTTSMTYFTITVPLSWYTSTFPSSLGQFTLCRVQVVAGVYGQVMLRLARGILNARPFLDSFPKLAKPSPDRLIFTTLAFFGYPESLFEVIEDPKAHLATVSPQCHNC